MPRHSTTAASLSLALALAAPCAAQQFVQQTSTRFPTQADYTNQCTAVDIDNFLATRATSTGTATSTWWSGASARVTAST